MATCYSFKNDILTAARAYQIEPALLCALIYVESKGNQWAVRVEPGFYRRYIERMKYEDLSGYKPHRFIVSEQTEKSLRATSFGLCQVMGETARVLGYRGHFLTELLPDTGANIELAAKLLSAKYRQHGSWKAALAAYNTGRGNHEATNYDEHVLDVKNQKLGLEYITSAEC